MKEYAIYEVSTGIIKQIGICLPSAFSSQQPSDVSLGLIETVNRSFDQYVDVSKTPHEIKNKTPHPLFINKTQIVADGSDLFVVSGIHNPSTVTWPDGQTDLITDGEVGFAVDQVGSYTIKLTSLKHFDEVINIEAIPTA